MRKAIAWGLGLAIILLSQSGWVTSLLVAILTGLLLALALKPEPRKPETLQVGVPLHGLKGKPIECRGRVVTIQDKTTGGTMRRVINYN